MRFRKAPVLIAVATGALAGLLAGCSQAESVGETAFQTEEWTFRGAKGSKITTEHYVLYTTCASREFVRALPTFLEHCWQAYCELMPPPEVPGHPLPAYLFQTRWQWEAFNREFAPERAETYRRIRSGGYSERGVTVTQYGSRRACLSVLAHEGFHQFVEVTRGRNLPAWLNEGLACYFEAFDMDATNRPVFRPESNALRRPALRNAVARDRLIPLRDILATNAGIEVYKPIAHVSSYYAQEWALVLFLMRPPKENPYHGGFQLLLREAGTEMMERRARILLAADTDAKMSQSEAVFRAYVTDDLDGFEIQFKAYAQKLLGLFQ